MNLTLPLELQSWIDNPVLHQDACRFALDQFVLFSRELALVEKVQFFVLGATVVMYLVLLWQWRKTSNKIDALTELLNKNNKEGAMDDSNKGGDVGGGSSSTKE